MDVSVIHSLGNIKDGIDKLGNMANIRSYFQYVDINPLGPNPDPLADVNNTINVSFSNIQLDCELNLVDSIKNNGDKFTFTVYNIPANTIFSIGDLLVFNIYWLQEANKKIKYVGLIKEVKTDRVSGDLKTVVKGEVVYQDLLYRWSIYEKYPLLKKWYEIPDFIRNELGLEFYSTMTGWETDIKLHEYIYTKNKTVGDIFDEICRQVRIYNLSNPRNDLDKDDLHWKLVNENTIIFYKRSDLGSGLLNDRFGITFPSIHYTDLFEYTNNVKNYSIQTVGIPTMKAGVVFHIDTTGVPNFVKENSAYFICDEVEHSITLKDGYNVKIYARKITQ
jgi:hypothetical protein